MEITFKDMQPIIDLIINTYNKKVELKEQLCGGFSTMKYPKILPIMKLEFHKYSAANFGNVSTLKTKAMFGKMQLATVVFTPNSGADIPLLLMDIMAFGKKRAVFIEYYDCTKQKSSPINLVKISKKYKDVEDYNEKPAWYIKERTPYSLIKGGNDETALLNLIKETAEGYAALTAETKESPKENLKGLSNFINRMVTEGNPSSETMNKILGKTDAERFFRTMVMPIENK